MEEEEEVTVEGRQYRHIGVGGRYGEAEQNYKDLDETLSPSDCLSS